MRFLALLVALFLASLPASSQVMLMTGAGLGTAAAPATPPSVTNTAGSAVTPNTTCDFTSVSIGTADATRRVVVGVASVTTSGSAPSFSAMTIGGVSASLIISDTRSGDVSELGAALFMAEVPTGTTADINTTFSGDADACTIGVWRVIDLTTSTPVDSDIIYFEGVNSGTMTLTTVNPGVAIGFQYMYSDGGAMNVTWTGLTENFERDTTTSDFEVTSGASATTSASSLNISTSNTNPSQAFLIGVSLQ